MQSFPMFLRTTGRRVVVCGGGETAAQKVRLMLKTDAAIHVAAPALDPELAALAARGRVVHDPAPPTPETFRGAALVFVGTGCPGLDSALHGLAKAGGAVVNVVDAPHLCDATTPALVDRDPVVVAIGTEGTAPVLARRIKTRVEEMLHPRLGPYAALAGRMRDAVAAAVPRAGRRAFWGWAFDGAPWRAHAAGDEGGAAALLKAAVAEGRVPEGVGAGAIALVGAGPGARDLLTLRAVARLQEADVIFYDRLSGDDALELARRDAERVFVGKTPGAHAWPQERITARIVAEARRGRRVVRLKGGDPSVFGRAAEELAAARAAGLPVEVVPGVTAASAAAAALGRPLTERGETGAVVLATGHPGPSGTVPDWGRLAAPGTTLALYMAVGAAPRIVAELRTAGVPGGAEVEVVAQATHAAQRVLRTTLDGLAAALAEAGIARGATLLVRHPHAAAGTALAGAA